MLAATMVTHDSALPQMKRSMPSSKNGSAPCFKQSAESEGGMEWDLHGSADAMAGILVVLMMPVTPALVVWVSIDCPSQCVWAGYLQDATAHGYRHADFFFPLHLEAPDNLPGQEGKSEIHKGRVGFEINRRSATMSEEGEWEKL